MTFAKLLSTVREERRLPPEDARPQVDVRVSSAEGYVGRHGLLTGPVDVDVELLLSFEDDDDTAELEELST